MTMRTTLTIDDSIMRAAKKKAAQEGRPLKAVIGDALRLGLGLMREARTTRGKFKLTVVEGRGVQTGVRLDDRDALFDLMDGR
jgi:hypothetical protein